jgi:hypothetical protein
VLRSSEPRLKRPDVAGREAQLSAQSTVTSRDIGARYGAKCLPYRTTEASFTHRAILERIREMEADHEHCLTLCCEGTAPRRLQCSPASRSGLIWLSNRGKHPNEVAHSRLLQCHRSRQMCGKSTRASGVCPDWPVQGYEM